MRRAGTAQNDTRKAMALIRRLTRPAPGLFDALERVEKGLTRPEKIDTLLSPLQTPQALAHLLSPSSKSTNASLKPRPAAEDAKLRALPSPPRVPDIERQKSIRPNSTSGAARAVGAKQPPVLSKTPMADKKPNDVSPGRNIQKQGKRGVTLNKPTTLREIADMRRSQRQKHQQDAIPTLSKTGAGTDDLYSQAPKLTSQEDAAPIQRGTRHNLHPLAALATSHSSLTLDEALQGTLGQNNADRTRQTETSPPTQDVDAAGMPPAPQGGFSAPEKTPATAASTAAASSLPSPKSAAIVPAAPHATTDSDPSETIRKQPKTSSSDPTLSEVAWRNGVEPQ